MKIRHTLRMLAGAAGLALGGCQSTAPAVPAVMISDDEAAMSALKQALAEAMGKARVELGAGDPTRQSRITVLPPRLGPLEGNSPSLPVAFDLMLSGETCFLVRVDTGARHDTPQIACAEA